MRRLLRAVPLVWWIAAVLAATATGTTVGAALDAAADARQQWGRTATAWVVVKPVAAGSVVTSQHVATMALPQQMLPPDRASEVIGLVARTDLHLGEIVIGRRLAGPERAGPSALLKPGERAITISALDGERPPVAVGDIVDLVAVPLDGGPARVVADQATVIAVDDTGSGVTVALDRAAALRTATALERARVIISLVG
ncbi:MAG: hypothetical protein ACR2H3_03485 [Acidimicrobiales bacterium]